MNQLAGRGMTPEQRDEEIEALTRDGWLSPVSNCFAILAGTGSILVMSFILGVTAGSASMLFPLPELVVLLGVSVQLLTPHLPNRELENRVTSLRQRFTDFEPRFYIFIRSFRNTRKGLFLTLIVTFAFMLVLLVNLLSLVSLVGLAFLVVGIASKISLAVGSYPIRSWNALGFFLCSATPGLYGLWFWYRETYRLPHFLVYWRNNQPNGHEIEPTDDLPQLVTRPPGYLLPPTILWIPVIWSLNGLNGGDPAIPDSILFSVGWVLAFLGVLWTVRWTFRNEPQPPKTDGRAILSSFYIQLTWLWIIFGGWVFPIKLVSIPELALMALLISILYFYDDFMIHLEYKLEFSELGITWGNVGLAGLLLVLLMVLVTTRVNPTNEWPLIGVGILLVILGLLNSIVVLMGKRA